MRNAQEQSPHKQLQFPAIALVDRVVLCAALSQECDEAFENLLALRLPVVLLYQQSVGKEQHGIPLLAVRPLVRTASGDFSR